MLQASFTVIDWHWNWDNFIIIMLSLSRALTLFLFMARNLNVATSRIVSSFLKIFLRLFGSQEQFCMDRRNFEEIGLNLGINLYKCWNSEIIFFKFFLKSSIVETNLWKFYRNELIARKYYYYFFYPCLRKMWAKNVSF